MQQADAPKRPTTIELIAEASRRWSVFHGVGKDPAAEPVMISNISELKLAKLLAQDAEAMAQSFSMREALLANPTAEYMQFLISALRRADLYCEKVEGQVIDPNFLVLDRHRPLNAQVVYRGPRESNKQNAQVLQNIRDSVRVSAILDAITMPLPDPAAGGPQLVKG